MFDDYIFVQPGFLRGAASALDVSGAITRGAFRTSDSAAEADRRALASDWRVIGRDAQEALETVSAEVEAQPAASEDAAK